VAALADKQPVLREMVLALLAVYIWGQSEFFCCVIAKASSGSEDT
jgi:hypothetical protein